ncbi:Hybrid signal transduction histidine kinase K like protein [Verticillium longisporum]|uniref:Hybrid signal transduction histidine kinase K like protein n=1 Tax=Verticillium longisporum TaxID=100787 RepID=A0A8I2ZYU7_VERLO|nr:Hybrid signal transduction histidine kinase K like protein [Verticillium longisporum]KAG7141315.1 Hybrid signal transduction histidine kinase K like protein [Verticillium longisporum]
MAEAPPDEPPNPAPEHEHLTPDEQDSAQRGHTSEDPLKLDDDRAASLLELQTLTITEVLDQDSRPTFVIDLDPDEGITIGAKRIWPVFCNSALRTHELLLDAVLGCAPQDAETPHAVANDAAVDTTYEDFSSWATGVTKFDNSKDVFPLSFTYRDMLWTGSTVRQRWRLISGNLITATSSRPASPSLSKETSDQRHIDQQVTAAQTDVSVSTAGTTLFSSTKQHALSSQTSNLNKTAGTSSDETGSTSTSARLHLATPEKAVADWTVPNPKGILSAHIAYARTVAWENTPLGPLNQWSREFRQTVNLVMGNPFPAALFWGSDLTMLYNEAYAAEVAGNKHPSLMGTGFSGPFSELWDGVSGIFAECARTGVSIRKEDDYLPIERHGFLEETFYSWSWTPLYGGTSRILGFYNAPFETTQSVLHQRRTKTINKVGENVARAKSIKQFWKLLMESFEDNHFDIPFALLYSVVDAEDDNESSVSSGSTMSLKSCHFEGSLGIPEGHRAAPKQLDLKRSRDGFIPAFRESMRTREPTLLHTRDGTLPEELLEGINWRGFGDPCKQAIIFPVRPTNGENVLAFLMLGISPRRFYDDGYKSFTSMLNRQMSTSLASFMLYEDEVKKSRDLAEAAALEQENLTQQLLLQTSRMRRMTELSPLGMYLVSPDGVLREGNDRYFEMTGHPRDVMYEMSFMEQIEDGSKKTMLEGWERLVRDHQAWTGELQLKKLRVQPVDLHGESIDYWVMATAQPEFAPDGSVRSVMGSITDISHLKWAQGLQNRRLQEAEETRRQQNEFIDITSHEMRNPLSAILQCADDILSTLGQHHSQQKMPSKEDVEACMDAAQTISLCVQHQKSIVDDILTVSKLDSNLLVITPISAQPVEVVKRAIKMFDPELQAKQIEMVYDVHPSFKDENIEWMMLDPSRVLQILINLITNAIKFTAGAVRRTITVSINVSRESPRTVIIPDFRYIPPRTLNSQVVMGEEWGSGEISYLNFRVTDTGVGLTPEEMKVLFERFSQASPRTHAQYGGSGLGLFISRQLAELHGGQIGVASKAASGSTFGFFIAARRADAPSLALAAQFLPQARDLGNSANFPFQILVPQRQDLASHTSAASDLVAAKTFPVPDFDPKNLDILVVEDNLVNQNVLVKQLKKVGSRVAVANDGVEALAFLQQTHWRKDGGTKLSVILMDLEMPNMDGLTCVGVIRKMQNDGTIRGHVPVIAVTANVRDEQVAAARRSGMDDVVSKPFRIPDLMKKVEALLGTVAGVGPNIVGA